MLDLLLEQRHWSDFSKTQAWAECMEILSCPVIKTPLSTSPVKSKGMQSNMSGTRLAAGVAGVSEYHALIRLRGSTPDLKGLLPYTWPLDQLRISSAL